MYFIFEFEVPFIEQLKVQLSATINNDFLNIASMYGRRISTRIYFHIHIMKAKFRKICFIFSTDSLHYSE